MTGRMRRGWFEAVTETAEEAVTAYQSHQAAMIEAEKQSQQ